MATLLQQKNCMKTLTNGGVAGGTNSGQQSRVLLPHEMVSSIPVTPMSTSSSSGVVGVGGSTAIGANSSLSTISQHHPHTHNHIHQQSLQQVPMHQPHQYSNNYGYYNNLHNNDATTSSIYRQHGTLSSSNTQLQHPYLQHLQQNSNNIHHPTTSASTTSLSTLPFSDQRNLTANSSTEMMDNTVNGSDRVSDSGGDAAAEEADSGSAVASNEQVIDEDQEPEPEIDIVINNVVCSFSVRCHLNLREIALNGINVEFRRENGMVTMKLRRPYTTASIWSSGRITCTGATSEDQAKIAARRYARCLQKLGFSVKFNNFRVVNVLGTCSMPWAIKIVNFSEKYKHDASYEPELHPGVTYKLKFPKATLKIFSTGSITVTASSVANVQAAIEHIFPLVYEFRKKRNPDDPKLLKEKAIQEAAKNLKRKRPFGHASNDPNEDMMYISDGEDFDDDNDHI